MSTTTSKKKMYTWGICWDILLIILTIFDLCWLMFDALYSSPAIAKSVDVVLPFYQQIHHNFYYYDGYIVGLFIFDFLMRWFYALYNKSYQKWYFYPFANWYDIIGCFPTAAFRVLRLFRVVSLLHKLNKWGIIQVNNWALYRIFKYYYDILLEELSDRIVIKVLTETKKEIQQGSSLTNQIKKEVVAPQKQQLSQMIVSTIQSGIRHKYPAIKPQLKKEIDELISTSIKNNDSIQQLEKIPMVGRQLSKILEEASSDIVFGVIDTVLTDLSNQEKNQLILLIIENSIEAILDYHNEAEQQLMRSMLGDSIDIIIQKVMIKQWQQTQDDSTKPSAQ